MYWLPLQAFACTLALFHLTEYVLAWLFMRQELSFSSLLLSGPYCIAMASAILEYALESAFLPVLKLKTAMLTGAGMVMVGEILRKSAMVTARESFTHSIHYREHPTNELITWGPYRHPGYLGWLIWAVGTQVLLCNPFCTLAFLMLACIFFRKRIAIEEQQLRQHFGTAYSNYAATVHTWIPFAP